MQMKSVDIIIIDQNLMTIVKQSLINIVQFEKTANFEIFTICTPGLSRFVFVFFCWMVKYGKL